MYKLIYPENLPMIAPWSSKASRLASGSDPSWAFRAKETHHERAHGRTHGCRGHDRLLRTQLWWHQIIGKIWRFPENGGTPIAGWFVSGKIPSRNG